MSRYDERARKRIRLWMAGHKATQGMIGKAAGHDQGWASLYLSGGINAGLEELAGMARQFGQNITDLFDESDHPDEERRTAETELLERMRGCDEHAQFLLLEFARRLCPDPVWQRGRRPGSR